MQEEKNTVNVEDTEEFQNLVACLKASEKFDEYSVRTKKIWLLELLGMLCGIALLSVLFFAPLFQIKVELFGTEVSTESYSFYNEIALFFKNYQQVKDVGFMSTSKMLLDLAIVGALMMVLCFLMWVANYYNFAEESKLRKSIDFAHFGDKNSANPPQYAFGGRRIAVGFFCICLSIGFAVGYYFFMKSNIDIENIFDWEGSMAMSYVPLINSVSLIWLFAAIILLAAYIGIYICMRKQGSALTRELETFCQSAKSNAAAPHNGETEESQPKDMR